jgi:hypothetical protein
LLSEQAGQERAVLHLVVQQRRHLVVAFPFATALALPHLRLSYLVLQILDQLLCITILIELALRLNFS